MWVKPRLDALKSRGLVRWTFDGNADFVRWTFDGDANICVTSTLELRSAPEAIRAMRPKIPTVANAQRSPTT